MRLKRALVDKEQVALPMFTSCSPGWIKFAEYYYPDFLPNLPPANRRSRCSGRVARPIMPPKTGIKPEDMVVSP
jgi:iron only hydrogenase large subunit-like protein